MHDVENCRNEKGFEMKIKLVLWLAVATMLLTGCATGENKKAAEATVGRQYTIRVLVLPEQRNGVLPFSVKKARYSRYDEKDLVPAMVIMDYLEAIATSGRLPLRVREGFLMKEGDQWSLAEWPPEVPYRQVCTSYPVVVAQVYYVVYMKMVR